MNMKTNAVAMSHETIIYESFRLEYTLLRTDPDDAALCPVYGVACTAHLGEIPAGTFYQPVITENLPSARRLFRLLTENAVFPDHMDDVIRDLRERWTIPEWGVV